MGVTAGIIVTGTEVLSGHIADQNGPWVSEQLRTLGIDVIHLTVCGDRPAHLLAQLGFLRDEGIDVIVTTGGLGPTADDLTVATVAEFSGRPLTSDDALRERIAGIIRNWRGYPEGEPLPDSLAAAVDKQALVPAGASPLEPTGTAPGIVVPATATSPAILVLPGPPRELQAMWSAAISHPDLAPIIASGDDVVHASIRAYGLSEPDLAVTLRRADEEIPGLDALEVTTCMRVGELEIDTRFARADAATYERLKSLLLDAHETAIYAPDGTALDDLLAAALDGHTIATAESCTGGMIAARLTDRAGSSSYVLGGIVSYANEVKSGALGVPTELIAELGAVSEPVAAAMADGARAATGASVAVSTSGIAGPGGAVPGKPVGTVCFGLAIEGRATVTVTKRFHGDRAAVRLAATNFALHLVLDALRK